MFPTNMQFLGRERDKERLAEAEHTRLVKIAKGQQSGYWGGLRTLTNWLGHHMVAWGAKLQGYSQASLPMVSSMEITDVEV